MLYENIIHSITNYIADEIGADSKKKDRIRFGLEILISTFLSVVLSLGLAKILGLFKIVVVILLVNGLMKLIAGGIHLKTVGECALFSALVLNFMAYLVISLQKLIYNVWPLFLVISAFYIFISLLLWSPAEVEEKPIKGERKRKTLRIWSIIVSALLLTEVGLSFYFFKDKFIIFNLSIIFGILFQVFTISPFAYKIIDIYYRIKSNLFVK